MKIPTVAVVALLTLTITLRAVLPVPPPSPRMPPPAEPAQTVVHVIQAGDTLSALARKYSVTVAAIQTTNPGVNPTRLQVGQKITIPVSGLSGSQAAANPIVLEHISPPPPSPYQPATEATNALGLDLFRQVAAASPGGNVLLSPYSIQSALAMTYAGADGDTRAEMARVLHFPASDDQLAGSFAALRAGLDVAVKNASARRASFVGRGGKMDSVEWREANRLFAERAFPSASHFSTLRATATARRCSRLISKPLPRPRAAPSTLGLPTRPKIGSMTSSRPAA